MPEYIEREAVLKEIEFVKSLVDTESEWLHGYVTGLGTAVDAISAIPAADVVEVVRCRDCKYRSGLNGRPPFMFYICTCAEGLTGAVRENNFCSYGERRDNDD